MLKMNDEWMPSTLRGKKIEPAFCQDQTDFHKLFFGITRAGCDDSEEIPFFLFGVRLLLHEYLALVLRGDLEPYEISEGVKQAELDGFKDFIANINEQLVKAGIPTKEEGGKIVFDYEEITKRGPYGEA